MNSLSRFSRWKSWQARDTLERLQFPGGYAIAISQANLADCPFALVSQIVYFGMTNAGGGLRSRLKQFDIVIRTGKGFHGGADRFRKDYPEPENSLSQFFVAVAPFECNVMSATPSDLRSMGAVAQMEFECFAAYVEHFGQLPKYNDRKKSPKASKAVVQEGVLYLPEDRN